MLLYLQILFEQAPGHFVSWVYLTVHKCVFNLQWCLSRPPSQDHGYTTSTRWVKSHFLQLAILPVVPPFTFFESKSLSLSMAEDTGCLLFLLFFATLPLSFSYGPLQWPGCGRGRGKVVLFLWLCIHPFVWLISLPRIPKADRLLLCFFGYKSICILLYMYSIASMHQFDLVTWNFGTSEEGFGFFEAFEGL